MTKVKASDKYRFPMKLDLGAYLPDTLTGDSAQYDLTAILIHKGTSASHGHYGVTLRKGNISCEIVGYRVYLGRTSKRCTCVLFFK